MSTSVCQASVAQGKDFFCSIRAVGDACSFLNELVLKIRETADKMFACSEGSLNNKRNIVDEFCANIRQLSKALDPSIELKKQLDSLADKIMSTSDKELAETDLRYLREKLQESIKNIDECTTKIFPEIIRSMLEKKEDLSIPPRDLTKCSLDKAEEKDFSLPKYLLDKKSISENFETQELEGELKKLQIELDEITNSISLYYQTKKEHIRSNKGKPTSGWMKKLNDLKTKQTRIGNAIGDINARLSSLGKLSNSLN